MENTQDKDMRGRSREEEIEAMNTGASAHMLRDAEDEALELNDRETEAVDAVIAAMEGQTPATAAQAEAERRDADADAEASRLADTRALHEQEAIDCAEKGAQAVPAGHRSGFVNIVGNPNVGKSTLMNDLVGERLSIITAKAQTTRHRIVGIVNTDDYQIVFSDTPGVLKPNYKMQEAMREFSEGALTDADVLLYVTDVVEDPAKNADFLAKVAKETVPVLLVINKVDLLKGNDELEAIVARWRELLPNAEVFPTSAKLNFNVDALMNRIVELLPVAPPYYGKDALTDKPARFFVTEIIREKMLLHLEKEVPYSVEVVVEKFEESEKAIHIMAVIYVERDSQKGIIIGKGGTMLKRIGTEARKDIEKFFDKSVYLELFVKVEKDWRNRESKLRAFGYME